MLVAEQPFSCTNLEPLTTQGLSTGVAVSQLSIALFRPGGARLPKQPLL